MAIVKGSKHYRLKVVPHRPIRNGLILALLILVAVLALISTYKYAVFRTATALLSEEQARELRGQLARLTAEVNDLRQEVIKYQVNADVDRQAFEDIRQQAVARREKIASLERDIAVYRIMASKKNHNPQGISFGMFSVSPEGTIPNLYRLKLAVQKLADGEDEFQGELEFVVVGQRDGKEEKIPLYQLEQVKPDVAPLTEKIPLSFKFFQNIEADVLLPEGFLPSRVDLSVKSAGKRNTLVVEGQLEWPLAK